MESPARTQSARVGGRLSASAAWPRLGLGCAVLGTSALDLEDGAAVAVIEAAIEQGMRFFDVAPLYGGGLAEERLGRALARLPRDDYVLCTKTGVTRPYAQTAIPQGRRDAGSSIAGITVRTPRVLR